VQRSLAADNRSMKLRHTSALIQTPSDMHQTESRRDSDKKQT